MSEQQQGRVGQENPDTYLPDWMEGTSTKSDGRGLWVLTVHGRCSCGNRARRLAPDWKVPSEWGGGHMTSNCIECLGTMEYSDQWERVDRVVVEYSELKPPDESSDGDWSRFICMRCGTEGTGETFDDIPHEEWCRHGEDHSDQREVAQEDLAE